MRPVRRLEKMNRILRREIQVLEIERDLETKVKEQVSQNQKDYYLREQLKAIQSELGDSGDGMDEIAEFIHPDQFEAYRRIGLEKGFKYVASGPLVRSSYNAIEGMKEMMKQS